MAYLVCMDELEKAGIPCLKDAGDIAAWVDGKADGKFGEWEFSRHENKWVAKTIPQKGMDRSIAMIFASTWRREIHLDQSSFKKAYEFHILTQPGLTAFAHLIKAFAKE
ncbi:MAG: hypothetical protein WC654_07800 [Patescibacteria group bacterium]